MLGCLSGTDGSAARTVVRRGRGTVRGAHRVRGVVAATGNPVLIDLYAGLTEAVERTVSEIDAHDDDPAGFPGHEELAAAIAVGDPDTARAAADRYLDAAGAIMERSEDNR